MGMDPKKHTLLWVGISLIIVSAGLLALGLIPGLIERSEPAIIFLSLAAVFVFTMLAAPGQWRWRPALYIPTVGFLAFGVVFLFNAITADWDAWAYAWMFCIGGIAAGAALALRSSGLFRAAYPFVLGAAAVCFIGFAIFGALVGGAFMRVFSILLVGLVGLVIVLGVTRGFTWLAWNPVETLENLNPTTPAPTDTYKPAQANAGLAEPLSKRELEVLALIEAGLSNAEIAERMVVAHSTVKTHINNIYTKLGTQSRTQAVRRARELGLLE
jgi:DNA-binding CsgD family transcriptional regulator